MSTDDNAINWAAASPTITWTPARARHVLNGPTMGTRYSAILTGPLDLDLRPLGAALQSAVDAVDGQMSNWQPASDVSRLNAAQTGAWVAVAPNLLEVLQAGLEIGRCSGGTFDIGLGQLVDAWGFGPKHATPNANAIESLTRGRQRSAPDTLEMDRPNARIRKPAPLQLDLCGIAKGYGVDQLALCLDAHGIVNYLVSIDGELRARGQRLDGAPWHIAIERPDQADRKAAATIALHDEAIATSGDYRHWHEHDGRRVSHTMDPRTGHPVKNGLASVSVLAPTAMAADAWATALLVAGDSDGPALAEANGLDALFILRHGDELLELPTGRFV